MTERHTKVYMFVANDFVKTAVILSTLMIRIYAFSKSNTGKSVAQDTV